MQAKERNFSSLQSLTLNSKLYASQSSSFSSLRRQKMQQAFVFFLLALIVFSPYASCFFFLRLPKTQFLRIKKGAIGFLSPIAPCAYCKDTTSGFGMQALLLRSIKEEQRKYCIRLSFLHIVSIFVSLLSFLSAKDVEKSRCLLHTY